MSDATVPKIELAVGLSDEFKNEYRDKLTRRVMRCRTVYGCMVRDSGKSYVFVDRIARNLPKRPGKDSRLWCDTCQLGPRERGDRILCPHKRENDDPLTIFVKKVVYTSVHELIHAIRFQDKEDQDEDFLTCEWFATEGALQIVLECFECGYWEGMKDF